MKIGVTVVQILSWSFVVTATSDLLDVSSGVSELLPSLGSSALGQIGSILKTCHNESLWQKESIGEDGLEVISLLLCELVRASGKAAARSIGNLLRKALTKINSVAQRSGKSLNVHAPKVHPKSLATQNTQDQESSASSHDRSTEVEGADAVSKTSESSKLTAQSIETLAEPTKALTWPTKTLAESTKTLSVSRRLRADRR